MNKLLTILFVAVIAIFALGFSCKKLPHGGIPITTEVRQTTLRGSRTFGPKTLSAQQLSAIDAGIAGAIRDASMSGYSQRLEFGFFEIFVPPTPCTLSPEQRVPSFRLRADDYDGTEFDQHNPKGKGKKDGIGVIFAAELVLSLGTPGSTLTIGQMYVCSDLSHLADAVRHGAEHILIANNDSDYYSLTWFHGNGFYHPLLPKRAARGEQLENRPFGQNDKIIIPVK